jgi:hypothetical protein
MFPEERIEFSFCELESNINSLNDTLIYEILIYYKKNIFWIF